MLDQITDIPIPTLDDHGVVKASVYGDRRRPTMQVNDDFFGYQGLFIPAKYNPEDWAMMLNDSSRLRRSVHSLARNTVGLGWDIVPYKEESDLTPEEKVLLVRETEIACALLEDPNPEPIDLAEILYRFKYDEESTGDGWLEITENRRGRPSGIYHAPSRTMRIASSADKFVQLRAGNTQVRFFKPWGDRRTLDPMSGDEAVLPFGKRATAMVHSRIYAADDDWYGAPRFVPAALSIANQKKSQQWNFHFLDNSAHLPYAVIIEGGNLNSESRESITRFIGREGKGIENAGRVLVLEPELQGLNPTQRDQVRIKLEKIAIGISDDGSFLKLRTADNEEIREAMGLPKIFLGTFDDANKSNSVIALRITVQQELEPEICRVETLINKTIMRGLGLKVARFRLRRPRILDPLQEAVMIQKLMVGFSINDMRRALTRLRGVPMPPLEGDQHDTPLAFFKSPQLLAMAENLSLDVAKAAIEKKAKADTEGRELDIELVPDSIRRMAAETDGVTPFVRQVA